MTAQRNHLILSHQNLVKAIARHYIRSDVGLDDLMSVGNIGLIKAVDNFDPEKGKSLGAYAALWIRSEMIRFLMETKSLVKIGSTRAERILFYNLRKLEAKGYSVSQIAEKLKVKPSEVTAMQKRLGYAKHGELTDNSATHPGFENDLIEIDAALARRKILGGALYVLTPNEHNVIKARWLADDPQTLSQVGTALGLSAERIRQIELKALKKLRNEIPADS